MAYSIIKGRFYYGKTDGDYFDFEGFMSGDVGAGSFVAGEKIKPGDPKGWYQDLWSRPKSYVKIKKAVNYPGSLRDHPSYEFDDLLITSYFDADSGRTVAPLKDFYDNGIILVTFLEIYLLMGWLINSTQGLALIYPFYQKLQLLHLS